MNSYSFFFITVLRNQRTSMKPFFFKWIDSQAWWVTIQCVKCIQNHQWKCVIPGSQTCSCCHFSRSQPQLDVSSLLVMAWEDACTLASPSIDMTCHSTGSLERASAFALFLPDQHFISNWKFASWAAQRCSTAPSLGMWVWANGLLSVKKKHKLSSSQVFSKFFSYCPL